MIKLNDDIDTSRMTPNGYKVAAKSRRQLRAIAEDVCQLLRELNCYKGAHFLDVNRLLENTLPQAGFAYHIIDDHELSDAAAFTIPEKHLIVLRNSVYEKLACNDPFSRYTVIHEFSHIILNDSVTLHRDAILGRHRWYEDSEWQANNLAAEIMMPVSVIQEFAGLPLLIMEACGVGAQAVTYRLNNLEREGVLNIPTMKKHPTGFLLGAQ